jgi:uncharacterized membrane protein HdeD (DUF308 family)
MEVGMVLRSWWAYALRGILALVFGVFFLAYPDATLKAFIIFAGIFLFVDGVVNMARSVVLAANGIPWGWALVWGVVGLLLGTILVRHTEFTLAFTATLVGIWAIFIGIAELALTFDLPPLSGRGFLAAFGLVSLAFGIVMLAWTAHTVYAFMVVVGVFLLARAMMNMVVAFYITPAARWIISGGGYSCLLRAPGWSQRPKLFHHLLLRFRDGNARARG